MKKFMLMLIAMVMTFGISNVTAATQAPQPKEKIEKVVFSVNLQKPEDAKEIKVFMSKQKGVKDVVVDQKAERVTITYDEIHTSEGALVKDLAKINIKAQHYVEPKKK
ncbi:MAG: hypothetical protein SNJ33_06590 [Rikenellaceae bacterium]